MFDQPFIILHKVKLWSTSGHLLINFDQYSLHKEPEWNSFQFETSKISLDVHFWLFCKGNFASLLCIWRLKNAFLGSTTTTTRHYAAWEQTTTTHFQPGHHSHPLLAASLSLNNSPVIRPIPNRLASPPETKVSIPAAAIKLGE